MSKSFLLSSIILATVLAGCTYPSQGEALDTCEEWKVKGKSEKMELFRSNKDYDREHPGWEWGEEVEDKDGESNWELKSQGLGFLISTEVVLHQRVCVVEEATSQVLGRENKDLFVDESPDEIVDWKNWKVVKRFRY